MCFLCDENIQQLLSKHGYELKAQIGKGKFGRAYRISSKRYSEDFVLKFIPIQKTRTLDDQKMEEKALEQLIHPNILSIYDVWEEMGGISLITEFCENGSYDQIIKQNGPLSKQQFITVAKQLLSALNYLHKKGYSHNDIKPANILMDAYGRPKLADFGLCALSDGKNSETIVRGTTLTMAPELFNRRPYNPFKSDIWSMGITFYIMAVGRTPWGDTEKEICIGASSGVVYYPNGLNKQVVELLSKMLQQNPDNRLDIDKLLELPLFKTQEFMGMAKSKSVTGLNRMPMTRNSSKISLKRNGAAVSLLPTFSI